MTRKLAHRHRVSKSTKTYILIAGLCVAIGVFAFWKLLAQLGSSQILSRPWRTNIVLTTSPLVVLSLPKAKDERPIILTLPEDAYVLVPYGYGKYRLDAVARLGVLEKRPELISETVADLLAVKIMGFINAESVGIIKTNSHEDLYIRLKSLFGFNWILSTNYPTDLNLIDRLLVAKNFLFRRPDQWVFLTAHRRDDIFRPDELPGQTRVKTVNDDRLEEFIGGSFEDHSIRQSERSIEVRNSTLTPRVGQNVARMLIRLGGKVITVTNETKTVPVCLIQSAETKKTQKLIAYFEREFGCEVETINLPGTNIVFIAGDRFAERWPVYLSN